MSILNHVEINLLVSGLFTCILFHFWITFSCLLILFTCRYGDEHKLAGFSATLQAIISFVENGCATRDSYLLSCLYYCLAAC